MFAKSIVSVVSVLAAVSLGVFATPIARPVAEPKELGRYLTDVYKLCLTLNSSTPLLLPSLVQQLYGALLHEQLRRLLRIQQLQ